MDIRMNADLLHCDLHDYLEIACIYGIDVELQLKNGKYYIGIPLTTRVKSAQHEILEFRPNMTNKTFLTP